MAWEMAQSELSRAIESGDATAQVNAQKRIAALSIDEAKIKRHEGDNSSRRKARKA